jgi:hypothetical protein
MPPRTCRSRDVHRPVVVAVAAVRVVQVALDQVIDVIAVGHRLVAAARAVPVFRGVGGAVMVRCAGRGVRAADFDPVLLDASGGHVVQVAVVEVIDVAVVPDARVAAVRAVDVVVAGVMFLAHFNSPSG